MLEWTSAGDGARLMMLVLHDDAEREYAYGPANGLPDTKVGTFSQALVDEAKSEGLDRDQHEERLEDDLFGGGRNEPQQGATLFAAVIAALAPPDLGRTPEADEAPPAGALRRLFRPA